MIARIWAHLLALFREALKLGRSAWTMIFRRRVYAPIVPPYVNVRDTRKQWAKFLILPVLGLFCIVYGFFYALTAPYLTVPFLFPTVALSIFAIWALPDLRTVPFTFVRMAFSAMIVVLILWPNYLAIALPGLPWITLLRMASIPMAVAFLVCLSVSEAFRARLMETLNAIPFIWKALIALVVMEFITFPFSKQPMDSLNKSVILQVTWTSVFLISVYMFRIPGRITRYLALVAFLAIPIGILTFLEFASQRVLWEGYIPDFLKIDEAAGFIVAEFRAGINEYRAKATFTTALGLAEFMALVTPLFLHYAITARTIVAKAAAIVAIAGIYVVVDQSGSRLGLVGMLVSGLAFLLFWAVQRRRRLPSDLISATVLFAYPFFFAVVLLASFTVSFVNQAVWGGHESASSNEARMTQLKMAVPKLLTNPIGHGTGMSGESLGYAAGQFVTVDNYYITIAMDYGVVGLIAHFGMFYVAIAYALRYGLLYAPFSKDKEAGMLIPLGVCLTVFVVIKMVFSQPDNHPIAFMMLGMVVALIYRLKQEPGLVPPPKSKVGAQSARGLVAANRSRVGL